MILYQHNLPFQNYTYVGMQTDIIGHVKTKLQIMLFLDMLQINKCLVILNGQPVPATMLEIFAAR